MADESIEQEGYPTKKEAASDHTMTQISVVKTITGIRADTLIHNDRDEVIVNHRDAKTLTIYDKNFDKLRSMELQYEIFDMTLTSSGDIIATDDHEVDRVIRITPSGDISIVCTVAPDSAWGVCVTDRQQIVVGQHHPVRLIVYSQDGSHVEQEIDKDENGQPLFTKLIFQVKQRRNGDYVVSDHTCNRIVCVSREGNSQLNN